MLILVTGGNGLLGRYLVTALLERGDTVRVLALPAEDASWLETRGVAIHRGDTRRPETLVAPMRGVDGVCHLAAMMGVWRPFEDYYAVNVTGTANVCRAALDADVCRFVHISSWTVYGMGVPGPIREEFPLKPLRESHVLTKTEGDKLVQRMIAEEGLPAVILRPGTFFGPGDQLHFGRVADRLCAHRWVIVGSGENALPFVYVTDVVQGLLLALDDDRAVGQIYNIGPDRPFTQRQFVHAVAEEVGVRPPQIRIPYRPLYAAGYAAEQIARLARTKHQPVVSRLGVSLFGSDNRHSIEKVQRELSYMPRTDLREGVRLTAAWYRERNNQARPHMHDAGSDWTARNLMSPDPKEGTSAHAADDCAEISSHA
jgi:nucleoside-diphosphate-sugar epimerase